MRDDKLNADFGRIDFSEEQADLLQVAENFCREKITNRTRPVVN